ncbi:hypothetical protein FRC08_004315 [Ceratobasidium sp. 394]|nr:hypothetical protein FRC08_004315 [Ceratobasidium sp. 394]
MDVIVDPPTDQYAAFPHQGINSGYGFDIDLMKRSMDVVGGPENVKKARWSNGTGTDPSSDAARFSNYVRSGAPGRDISTAWAPMALDTATGWVAAWG